MADVADDMGLGKTVTVLALLEARRAGKDGAPRASLVVAPRSLLFNWKREAELSRPSSARQVHGSGTTRCSPYSTGSISC